MKINKDARVNILSRSIDVQFHGEPTIEKIKEHFRELLLNLLEAIFLEDIGLNPRWNDDWDENKDNNEIKLFSIDVFYERAKWDVKITAKLKLE